MTSPRPLSLNTLSATKGSPILDIGHETQDLEPQDTTQSVFDIDSIESVIHVVELHITTTGANMLHGSSGGI